MKRRAVVWLLGAVFLIAACQTTPVCPPDSVTYVEDPSMLPGLSSPDEVGPTPTPTMVDIGRKTIEVDRVIHGPLCNDHWSGRIYVACDVEIVAWTEETGSKFLDGCDLIIEPGTVVYVAAHNNAPYYKGCASCHATGNHVEE